jgi:cytochrome c556
LGLKGVFMKKGLLTAAIISISCSSTVFAASCDDTKLHGYMENIKDEMRSMSSDVKSGDNESAAKRANTLITYFEKARSETPYKFTAENLQGNELKDQKAEFTKVVDDTIVVLKDLETALKSGNSSEVKKLLGAMGNQRKTGHSSFKANC